MRPWQTPFQRSTPNVCIFMPKHRSRLPRISRLRILASGDLVYEFSGIKQRGAKLARHTCVWFVKKPWNNGQIFQTASITIKSFTIEIHYRFMAWAKLSSIDKLIVQFSIFWIWGERLLFVSFDSSIQIQPFCMNVITKIGSLSHPNLV